MNCVAWSVIDCFEDVDDKLNSFNLLFNPILDDHAPIKKIKLLSRPNPCVTDDWKKITRKYNDPLDWTTWTIPIIQGASGKRCDYVSPENM